MTERLDRIESEIERMLSVQRELQESQIWQEDRMNQLTENSERNTQSIAQLVNVVTVHQDSMERLSEQTAQLKRAVDHLMSQDGA